MRLDVLHRSRLSPEQLALFTAITTGARADNAQGFLKTGESVESLAGPFNVLLYSPKTGLAVQQLGAHLRYGSLLTPRERELVILTVAAAESSEYEQAAHEAIALAIGLSPSDLQALREQQIPRGLRPAETAVATLALRLALDKDLSDTAYEASRRLVSEPRIVDVVATVGYYQSIALLLRTFRVHPPTSSSGVTTEES